MIEAGAAGAPVFQVDGGDFAWTAPQLPERRAAQQRRKAQLLLDAYALSGMDAMVPGDGDLALGVEWLAAEAARTGAPFVAANLTCAGAAPFPATRRVERGGVTLGFVGLLGTSLSVPDGCAVADPVPAAEAAVAALGAVDLVVALTHQPQADDAALAQAIDAIDLVVTGFTGGVWADPRALPGGALHLSSGSRGKKLGLATVTLVDGGAGFASEGAAAQLETKRERTRRRLESAQSQRERASDDATRARADSRIAHYEQELADLDAQLAAARAGAEGPRHRLDHALKGLTADVADHPETLALLEAAKAEIEGARVTVAPQPVALEGGPFVGSQVCAGCHPGPAKDWAATRHAKATATLVHERRSQDLDCYGCHVTGAFHEAGPKDPAAVPYPLQSVGCESCHGPGRAHAESAGQAGELVAAPGEAVCVRCHDGEQDEGRFDLAHYLPRVDHDPETKPPLPAGRGVPADDPAH